MAHFFDALYAEYPEAKIAANWILGDIAKLMNSTEKEYNVVPLSASELAFLLKEIKKGSINNNSAKTVLEEMFDSDKKAADIIAEHGFSQISDTSVLDSAVAKIIEANPKPVADYKAGKQAAIGFLVGQVMKETKGQANPGMVKELLEKALN